MDSVKGKIQDTKLAKSGKTLGVKVNGKWYRSKEFSLQHEVGTVIDFDCSTSTLPDGTTLYWINDFAFVYDDNLPEYTESASNSPPPPPPSPPASTVKVDYAQITDNSLLLEFVGRCFSGYPFQTTDEPHIRHRARMLYLLGKDILSGKIEEVETGPRRKEPEPEQGIPGYSPLSSGDQMAKTMQENADRQELASVKGGDFDDDIPF